MVLWWLKGNDNYKQFVTNRVQKIQSHQQVQWRHVPTDQNPADVGSRGGELISQFHCGPMDPPGCPIMNSGRKILSRSPARRSMVETKPTSRPLGEPIRKVMKVAVTKPTISPLGE